MYGTRPMRPARQVPVSTRPVRRTVGPLPWLAAVAVFFAAVQLAFVVPGSGPAWDETVYVSQVGGNAPAAFFSAPRARGISYLVAPVAALTASTTALRIYLALMSAAALFAALRIWRTVLPTPVLVGAGALFAGLWPTLFYGPAAMPNLWCALGSLAATGWAVRTLRGDPRRAGTTTGAASAVALVALMRPADGFWLALPLMLAAVLVPGRRRPSLCAALAGGLVAGCAPWIAEAYAHYGGLVARLHRAGEIQGGLGWNFAVDDHLRALAGRTLCRPCDIGWESPATAVWWAALPLLTAGGSWRPGVPDEVLWHCWRQRRGSRRPFRICSWSSTRRRASCSPPTRCWPCRWPSTSRTCSPVRAGPAARPAPSRWRWCWRPTSGSSSPCSAM